MVYRNTLKKQKLIPCEYDCGGAYRNSWEIYRNPVEIMKAIGQDLADSSRLLQHVPLC